MCVGNTVYVYKNVFRNNKYQQAFITSMIHVWTVQTKTVWLKSTGHTSAETDLIHIHVNDCAYVHNLYLLMFTLCIHWCYIIKKHNLTV